MLTSGLDVPLLEGFAELPAGGLGVAAVVGEQRVVLDTHRAVPFDDREAVSGA